MKNTAENNTGIVEAKKPLKPLWMRVSYLVLVDVLMVATLILLTIGADVVSYYYKSAIFFFILSFPMMILRKRNGLSIRYISNPLVIFLFVIGIIILMLEYSRYVSTFHEIIFFSNCEFNYGCPEEPPFKPFYFYIYNVFN